MGWAVFFAKVSLFLLNPAPPQFKQLRETSETQHLCLLNPTLFLCGAKECSLHALRSLSELWLSWLTWFQTVPFIKTRVLSCSSFQSLRIKVQTFSFWYHNQKNGISYTLQLWLVPYDVSFYGLGRISFYYPEGIVYYSRRF